MGSRMLKSMLLNSFTYHCICTTIFLGYCGSIVYGEPYKFEKGWGSYEIESGNAYNPIAIDLNRRFVYMCGYNVIQKCDMNGNFVLEWGGKGALNGQFHNPEAMAVDSDGNVYVADTFNHRIQKFDGMGNFLTKWGSEGTQPGQFNRPSGIKIDSAGIVYVVDTFNHRIQTFDGNGVFLSQWGRLGLDDMNLQFPEGIALGQDDTIYIADTSNQQIKKFTKNGSLISVIANKGTGDGAVSWPQDLEVDGAGNLFVVDSSNYRVQKFDRAGMFVAKWGGQGQGLGRFNYPQRVAIDQNDDVYVTDPALGTRVQHFNNNGDFIKTWGSYGAKGNFLYAPSRIATDSSNHSYIVESGFNAFLKYDASGTLLKKVGFLNAWNRNTAEVKPMGISVDSEGNVFVLDSYNHRVQKFDKEGAFVLQWGAPGSGDGELKDPCDLAIDSADNVYILDKENNRVQKFDKNGQFILKWGDWETLGFPRGLGIDSQDRVYVAAGSHRILKFDSMGNLLLTWGSRGFGDGEFGYLNGIGIDKDDFVYVVDAGNNRIQKFDSTGRFVNKWGNFGKGQAEFYIIEDVAIDGLGNILVLDSQNARVKKFSQVEFLISGFVKDRRGFGVEGATVTLTGHSDAKYVTGPDGFYVFQGLPTGDYTVTSQEAGREFSPVSYTYSNLDNDKTNQIFQWSPDILPADIMPIAERTADSITWVWKDNSVKETGYRLWSDLDEPTPLASLPADTVSWKQGGLTPNTSYQLFVEVYDDQISTRSALSPIVYTKANPPKDLVISDQFNLFLRLSVDRNINPAGTVYELEADIGDGKGFKPIDSETDYRQKQISFAPPLSPNTIYKFRVKAINRDEHITEPSNVIEFSTFETFTRNYYGLDVETIPDGTSFVAGYEDVISSLGPKYKNGWFAKYNASQVLVSSVIVPGAWFNGITRDREGDLFVVGGKESYQYSDLYLARYSPSLVLMSSETISGDPYGDEEANEIEYSPEGDLVILGRLSRSLGSSPTGWIARLGKDFKVKNDTFYWNTFSRHSLDDLAFDAEGNIYVSGVHGGTTSQSGFVAKYSPDLIKETWNSYWSSEKLGGKKYGRSQVEFSTNGELYASFDYSKNGEYSQIRILKLNSDLTMKDLAKFDTDVTESTIQDLKISADGDVYLAAGFSKEGSSKSLGWVGRFSPGLLFVSSQTFSGTNSTGLNTASGLKIAENALYTVGTITDLSGQVGYLSKTALTKNPNPDPVNEDYPGPKYPLSDELSSDNFVIDSEGVVYLIYNDLNTKGRSWLEKHRGLEITKIPLEGLFSGLLLDHEENLVLVGTKYREGDFGWVNQVWVSKYDRQLNFLRDGSFSSDERWVSHGYSGKLDKDGNVYVVAIGSRIFPRGRYKTWVGKFDSNLVYQSSHTFEMAPESQIYEISEIEIGSTNNLYMIGNLVNETSAERKIWLGKTDLSFGQVNETIIDSPYSHSGRALYVDSSENVYIVSHLWENSWPRLLLSRFDSSLVLKSSATFAIPPIREFQPSSGGFTGDGKGNLFVAGSIGGDVTGTVLGGIGVFSSDFVHQGSIPTSATPVGHYEVVGLEKRENSLFSLNRRTLDNGELKFFVKENNLSDVTPTRSPTTPSNLVVAQKSSTTLTLQWDPSGLATGYRVQVFNQVNDPREMDIGISSFTTVEALTPNSNYAVAVKACNSVGCSPYTTIETNTLTAAPISLKATSVQATSVILDFNSNGNPAETEFIVEQSAMFDGPFQLANEIPGRRRTVTNLSPDTDHYFRVLAKNRDGSLSEPSNVLKVKTGKSVVSLNAKLETLSNTGIEFSVTSGGEGLTYRLSVATSPTPLLDGILRSIDKADHSANIDGLTPNLNYFVFMQACDGDRCSDYKDLGPVTTLANKPRFRVEPIGPSKALVRRFPDGNSEETVYTVEQYSESDTAFIQIYKGNSLEIPVSNLASGKEYRFRITVNDPAGQLTSASEEVVYKSNDYGVNDVVAYPVPFKAGKGVNVITFDRLPEGATLRIYSMAGGLVKELRAESSTAYWNAKNDEGEDVVSGVYFVRVSGSGGDKTFKIVVQR